MQTTLKLTSVAGLTAAALITTNLIKKESVVDFSEPLDSTNVPGTKDIRTSHNGNRSSAEVVRTSKGEAPAKTATDMARLGEDGVDEILLGLSRSSSHRDRLIHADALALIGSQKAINGLLAHAMAEADRDTRAALLESLKALSNPDGLPALSGAVTRPLDSRSLKATIDALGRLADSSTINQLVEKYRTDPMVKTQRGQITKALANVGNVAATRTLASIARTSPEPGLVEAAARALSKIGNTTAAQGLVDTLARIGDSDPTLFSSISELIRRVDHPDGQRILANLQND